MKNNKGFTFVELLSVIVVLGIIILMAMPVYNSVKNRLEKRNYENKIKLIEVAAAKYSEDTNIEVMYVDDLVKDGYLEADNENGHVLHPLNQEETLNCYMVKSQLEGNLYYAKFQNKEYREENGCSLNALNEVNQTFQIKMYEEKVSKETSFSQFTK